MVTLSYQVLATEWFRVGRGTVATMATVVSGLSNTLLSPVAGAAVMHLGLRQAALAAAMLLLVLTAVVTMLMICRGPSYYGMERSTSISSWGKRGKGSDCRGLRRLTNSPCHFASSEDPACVGASPLPDADAYGRAILLHQRSGDLCSMGFDVAQASIMLSVVYIGSMIVVPLFGFLSDRFGRREYC